MFGIDLILGLIQLAALGGGSIFLWQDYKHDFIKSKALYAGVTNKVRRLTGMRESEVEKANNTVQDWAKNIARLRDSLASIEASRKQALRQNQEQRLLVADFQNLVTEALKQNDENAAATAAFGKVQAERRAQLFADHAETNAQVARFLGEELEGVEMDFEAARTQADTIRVNSEIADAKKQLYGLVSDIAVEGFTPKGQLEQSFLTTEHDMLKAGVLVDLATKRGGKKRIERFKQLAEVNRTLSEARDRLALNPAPPEEVARVDDREQAVTAELVS